MSTFFTDKVVRYDLSVIYRWTAWTMWRDGRCTWQNNVNCNNAWETDTCYVDDAFHMQHILFCWKHSNTLLLYHFRRIIPSLEKTKHHGGIFFIYNFLKKLKSHYSIYRASFLNSITVERISLVHITVYVFFLLRSKFLWIGAVS